MKIKATLLQLPSPLKQGKSNFMSLLTVENRWNKTSIAKLFKRTLQEALRAGTTPDLGFVADVTANLGVMTVASNIGVTTAPPGPIANLTPSWAWQLLFPTLMSRLLHLDPSST